jgi:hypothetical protein
MVPGPKVFLIEAGHSKDKEGLTVKKRKWEQKRLTTHLFCREISDIFMVLLAPGVENPAQQPVHKDHVHAPVGQRVLMLHVPVSRQHQVDPRLVPEPGTRVQKTSWAIIV